MARERGKSWKFSPIIVNYWEQHARTRWTFHCFDRWIGPRGGGRGVWGRAHYRLEFLESRTPAAQNINRYWKVGRGLIVNVSTMIRVAKSREGLNVVEWWRPVRSEFRNRSFKWVLSVLDRESLILFSRFFFFFYDVQIFFCSEMIFFLYLLNFWSS